MSTIDVDALIPDGFEPIEALRCWNFEDGKLRSLTMDSHIWIPGKPLEAECALPVCRGSKIGWTVKRRGMSREHAEQHRAARNDLNMSVSGPGYILPPMVPEVPQTTLPDGYGYAIEAVDGAAPHESCTCGIYAAMTEDQLPGSGLIVGKVKLWGKIIPGERGYRAQYAYPSAFEVPAYLADDPALKAFGVPITVSDKKRRGASFVIQINDNRATISGPGGGATVGLGGGGGAAASVGGGGQGAALRVVHIATGPPSKRPRHWANKVAITLNLALVAITPAVLFHWFGL